MPSTTFFLRSAVAPQPSTLPSAWGGTFTNVWNSSYQHSLEANSGSSQQTFHSSYTPAVADASTDNAGSGQFISHNNLIAGSYGTGTWTMGFAGKLTTIPAGANWTYRIGIFLFDSTGALKTTIAATQNGAGANTTANTELTTYSASISGSAFTIASGDYLVFEIGLFFTNNSGSTWNTGIGNCYDSGTTAISSDGATIASAQSFIQAPFALLPTDLSTWQPPQDPPPFAQWRETARKWWNAIRSIPATVIPEPAFFLNDPFKTLPVADVFQLCATVDIPRNSALLKTRQFQVAQAQTFVDGGPAFLTDDPFKRTDWQTLPIETPAASWARAKVSRQVVTMPDYFPPTAYSIFSLTIPPAFVFQQMYQDQPGRMAFTPPRPDPTELFDESLYPDFTGLIQAQPWQSQSQYPVQTAWRHLTPYSNEIHVTLPYPLGVPLIEDWSGGPQVPVRTLRSPRHQDNWPASDPILVNPVGNAPFPSTQPSPLPSRVRRPLPPREEVPILVSQAVIPPGPQELSHAYEFQVGAPVRTAYRRPHMEGGAVRTPTFLVEVIEDVYQVWNVQIAQPVRRQTLPPQTSHVAELSTTAPAQMPVMDPLIVSHALPVRRQMPTRTGETTTKVLPFLEDVTQTGAWNAPVAPRPRLMPHRPHAQPETIATLPEAVDVRIWRFELCQTHPVSRANVAPRAPIAQPIIPAVTLDPSLLAVAYTVAHTQPARRQMPHHTQQVTLERTAPAQIPQMEPFMVTQQPIRRQPIIRQPADSPGKVVPALEDVYAFQSWVQPPAAYPPRQPRPRPLTEQQQPPLTAFFTNIPYDPASFQVWNVNPQPVPQWRRPIMVGPQRQDMGEAEPSWLGARVIIVSGPYVCYGAQIYCAGAVQGQIVCA